MLEWTHLPEWSVDQAKEEKRHTFVSQFLFFFSAPGTSCGSIKPGPCGDQPCLFNLTSDLGEHHDISDEYPGIADSMYKRYQQLVAELGNQDAAKEEVQWLSTGEQESFSAVASTGL